MLLKVNVLNSAKKLFNEIYNIGLRLDYMTRQALFKIFKESKCVLMNSEKYLLIDHCYFWSKNSVL